MLFPRKTSRLKAATVCVMPKDYDSSFQAYRNIGLNRRNQWGPFRCFTTAAADRWTVPYDAVRIGDKIELFIDHAPNSTATGSTQFLLHQGTSSLAANLSYALSWNTSGLLRFQVSDGTNIIDVASGSSVAGISGGAGVRQRIKVLYIRDTGAGQFSLRYYRTSDFSVPVHEVTDWVERDNGEMTGTSIGATRVVSAVLTICSFYDALAGGTYGSWFGASIRVNDVLVYAVDWTTGTEGFPVAYPPLAGLPGDCYVKDGILVTPGKNWAACLLPLLGATDDFDLIMRVKPATGAGSYYVIGQLHTGVLGSWGLIYADATNVTFRVFDNSGVAVNHTLLSSSLVTADWKWLRLTRVASTGVVQFWLKDGTSPVVPESWGTADGSVTAVSGTLSSTNRLLIGHGGNVWKGECSWVQYATEIDGDPICFIDFRQVSDKAHLMTIPSGVAGDADIWGAYGATRVGNARIAKAGWALKPLGTADPVEVDWTGKPVFDFPGGTKLGGYDAITIANPNGAAATETTLTYEDDTTAVISPQGATLQYGCRSIVTEVKGPTPGTSLNGSRYIEVRGNYAYVCCYSYDAVAIIDITDPAVPVWVSAFRGPTPGTSLDGARAIVFSGNYAFVGCGDRNSVAVLDFTDPVAPVWVTETQGPTPDTSLDGVYHVALSGNYLYVACTDRDSLAIIDVTDPTVPVWVTEVRGPTPGTSLDGASGVLINGNYAYVGCQTRRNVAVIDITTPTSPVWVTEVRGPTPGTSLDGATFCTLLGNYLLVGTQSRGSMAVLDVTNPASPTWVTEIRGPESNAFMGGSTNVSVSGNRAYVSSSVRESLTVIDITNPAAPLWIGEIAGDIYGTTMDQCFYNVVVGDYVLTASLNGDVFHSHDRFILDNLNKYQGKRITKIESTDGKILLLPDHQTAPTNRGTAGGSASITRRTRRVQLAVMTGETGRIWVGDGVDDRLFFLNDGLLDCNVGDMFILSALHRTHFHTPYGDILFKKSPVGGNASAGVRLAEHYTEPGYTAIIGDGTNSVIAYGLLSGLSELHQPMVVRNGPASRVFCVKAGSSYTKTSGYSDITGDLRTTTVLSAFSSINAYKNCEIGGLLMARSWIQPKELSLIKWQMKNYRRAQSLIAA
jgi:hypothetical protein